LRPIEAYLSALGNIRASGAGVAETSYYSPLEQLLTAIGATLTPKVHCVIHLRNAGAGIPDGGFFTPDQLRGHAGAAFPSPMPARGALEVKATSDEVGAVARSAQVARYIARYGQVLVTNYRDFLLVAQDGAGTVTLLEAYRLAESEAAFWAAATLPAHLGGDARGAAGRLSTAGADARGAVGNPGRCRLGAGILCPGGARPDGTGGPSGAGKRTVGALPSAHAGRGARRHGDVAAHRRDSAPAGSAGRKLPDGQGMQLRSMEGGGSAMSTHLARTIQTNRTAPTDSFRAMCG
jgi:hypothetical protein